MVFLLFFILLFQSGIKAQNLIPNPSFEFYQLCPLGSSYLSLPSNTSSVFNWSRPTVATSDYYNSCSNLDVSIPSNIMGFQYAKSGSGYAGIYAYVELHIHDWREYLQTPLLRQMNPGHQYLVGYWVSLGEGQKALAAVDRLGVHFRKDSIQKVGNYDSTLSYLQPQLETPKGIVYGDTVNWVNVFGLYTAIGGERWMILGNFVPRSKLAVSLINGSVVFFVVFSKKCG